MDRVQIGYVARAHGVRGVVRVEGASGGALAEVSRVFVGERAYSIASAEPIAEGWLVKLDGVDDRDAAEALRGQALTAPRDELPPPGPDEVYLSDLVGCAVVDREGAAIGSVSRVVDSGAQELLVVTRPDGREALVPFIAPIVVSVDEAGRRIVCDPPEGLLDL